MQLSFRGNCNENAPSTGTERSDRRATVTPQLRARGKSETLCDTDIAAVYVDLITCLAQTQCIPLMAHDSEYTCAGYMAHVYSCTCIDVYMCTGLHSVHVHDASTLCKLPMYGAGVAQHSSAHVLATLTADHANAQVWANGARRHT